MQKIIKRVITLVLMGVHGGENREQRERQFNTFDSSFFRDKLTFMEPNQKIGMLNIWKWETLDLMQILIDLCTMSQT